MSRTVFCKKYQKEMEGLDAPPYPGPKGEEIFESVSKQAWMGEISVDCRRYRVCKTPPNFCMHDPRFSQ